MNNRPTRTGGTNHVPSLADFLTAGFGAFLRRPFVVLIPILLDMWLRYGIRIAPEPFVGWAGSWLERGVAAGGDLSAAQAFTSGAAQADVRLSAVVTQQFTNLLRSSPAASSGGVHWIPADGWTLLLVVLALNIGALVATSAMLVPLGEAVAGRAGWGWRRMLPTAWKLAQLLLLIGGLGLVLALPLLICIGFMVNFSPLASQIAIIVVVLALMVFWLLASFGVEAIVVTNVSPLVALYQSYNLVRTNSQTALLLVLVSLIVGQGFALLLRPLVATEWGTLAASGIYAVLGSTLAAARMVFYRERVAQLAHTTPVALTHK
jgi:hypothetical protein